MKQTINLSQFRNAFARMDRSSQFSYDALELIYSYLEELDENMELDVIAICCDLSESDYGDVFNTYPIECDSEEPTEKEVKDAVMEYLYDNTSVIGQTEKTVIFAQF
jgi:hypothetical protein